MTDQHYAQVLENIKNFKKNNDISRIKMKLSAFRRVALSDSELRVVTDSTGVSLQELRYYGDIQVPGKHWNQIDFYRWSNHGK